MKTASHMPIAASKPNRSRCNRTLLVTSNDQSCGDVRDWPSMWTALCLRQVTKVESPLTGAEHEVCFLGVEKVPLVQLAGRVQTLSRDHPDGAGCPVVKARPLVDGGVRDGLAPRLKAPCPGSTDDGLSDRSARGRCSSQREVQLTAVVDKSRNGDSDD